jgi:hypothetical protein
MKQFKLDTIESNLKARHEEAAGYEVNIFNYEFMLRQPEIDPDFAAQLPDAIASNQRELDKVHLVIKALEAQKAHLINS